MKEDPEACQEICLLITEDPTAYQATYFLMKKDPGAYQAIYFSMTEDPEIIPGNIVALRSYQGVYFLQQRLMMST